MKLADRIEADPFGDAIGLLMASVPDPFFVQVGGYDGVSFDPLRPHVVARDLRGLIVEPVPHYFEKLQALYAGSGRVTPVNCAVAEEDGRKVIWRFDPEAVAQGVLPPHFGGISSFLMEDLLADTGVLGRSSPNPETTAALRSLLQPVDVRCCTMAALLDEQRVERVDILQIDTEGYDYRILQLFDFERFRPAIVHYEHQHLPPADRAAAEELLRRHGYTVTPERFDTLAVLDAALSAADEGDPMLRLGRELLAEGRPDRALTIFEHVASLRPLDPEPLTEVVAALGAGGRTLEVLHRLADLQSLHGGPAPVADQIREHGTAGVARFNQCVAGQQIEEAAQYAGALARLMPTASGVVAAALSCNQALGRREEAERYARALAELEPGNVAAHQALADLCKERGDADGEVRHRAALALADRPDVVPLIRLRDIHDVASMILCRPLTEESAALLRTLLAAGRSLPVEAPEGSEWTGWIKHYRVLLEAIDLAAIEAPTPAAGPEPDVAFMSARGRAMDWKGVQARAKKLGAQVVFFAAADAHYVELYARWYVLSLLKYCDVPFMVVVHVIGGADALRDAAKTVAIQDDRLVFCGDWFDASAVTTAAYDAPPKGRAEKPIAHFQCVRFQRLGELLNRLGRPVFVSDIDLLLQRGVTDLLARCEAADVVLNENGLSFNAGSRITANLLLLKPTGRAQVMLRFLRAYLDDKLSGAEVTRWIDQVALVHARHHLVRHAPDAEIAYFDTASDINNVMYPSFQAHPFRFLSLYHGFDTSSLEDPRVLGAG